MIQTSGPMQTRARESYASPQVANDPTGLFACDDPSMVAYLQNYTPLQPTRILGMQPSTSGEEMLYPETLSHRTYPSNSEAPHSSGLGIQGTLLTEPLGTNRVMAAALPSDMTSPSLTSQPSYGGMSERYDALRGYGEAGPLMVAGSDVLGMPGTSNIGGVYNPHQRTPSARRGPFKDHEKREKTAHTRRIGSCIRCRMQRIRVGYRMLLMRNAEETDNKSV